MIRWLALVLALASTAWASHNTPAPTHVLVGIPTHSPSLAPVMSGPTHAPVTESPTHAPVTESPTHAPVTESPTIAVTCGAGTVPSLGECFVGHTISTDRVFQSKGSCYLFGDDGGLTWRRAKHRCESVEGHLVTINNRAEDIFIAERALALGWAGELYWIGIKEQYNSSFIWDNSRSCSWYRNWQDKREIVDPQPTERCVGANAEGFRWEPHKQCDRDLRYVCEGQVTVGTQRSCVDCAKGEYSYERSNGNVACASCPWGRFNSRTGQAECEACPTFSPASLLAKIFNENGIDEVRVTKGGSVLCSGLLGPAQRDAFILMCVFAPFVFLLICCGVPFCGTACCITGRTSEYVIAVCWLFATPWFIGHCLIAQWLGPIVGTANFNTGRRTATSESRGCDPQNRHNHLIAGLVFYALPIALPLGVGTVIGLVYVVSCIYLAPARWRARRETAARRAQDDLQRVQDARDRAVLVAQLAENLKDWEQDATEATKAIQAEGAGSLLPRALLCTLCRTQRASALNMPCNHLFFCEACARDFRSEVGNVCNGCREPSTIALVVRKGQVVEQDDIADAGKVRMVNLALDVAPVARLRELAQSTRDWKTHAKAVVLNRTCAVCADSSKPLVIDVPCGHATVCESCARENRTKHGDFCFHCSMPSTVRLATSEQHCAVCLDEVNGVYLAAVGVCGHQLCTSCSVEYVRAALDNVSENVHADGLRCPLHYSGCKSKMSAATMRRLIQRQVRPDVRSDTLPLTVPELDRLERFMYEASIDKNEIFACCHRECARVFAVPNRDQIKLDFQHYLTDSLHKGVRAVGTTATGSALRVKKRASEAASFMHGMISGRAAAAEDDVELTALEAPNETAALLDETPPPLATCPWCSKQSCVRCSVPAHGLMLCSQIQKDPNLRKSSLFIQATTKNCPKCKVGVTHYHGHACHHIVPGSGCKNCGTHFCYTCLKRGHSGRACGCKLFCASDGILANLTKFPYPHDERCSCPICPECRLGQQCELCDGQCVVCLGRVRPGPNSLDAVENWEPRP